MIRWAREVIALLRELNARLERIEANQKIIMREYKGRKFIATGPQNS
jgi:hypothetical protein